MMKQKTITMEMIEKDGWLLVSVPGKEKTYEMCYLAICNASPDGRACPLLRYVPEHLRTYELCARAVSIHGKSIEYIPTEILDEALCLMAIESDKNAPFYIPQNMWSENLSKAAVSKGCPAHILAMREIVPKKSKRTSKKGDKVLSVRYTAFDTIDWEWVKEQEGLWFLEFEDQHIDVRELVGCHEMRSVQMRRCTVENFDLIPQVPGLSMLSIYQMPGYDWNHLTKSNLWELIISECNVKDIGFVSSMPYLETLCLGSNQIQDITPLANLHRLDFLVLAYNQISNIEVLGCEPRICERGSLFLANNSISNIAPLLNGKNYYSLDLRDNSVGEADKQLLREKYATAFLEL